MACACIITRNGGGGGRTVSGERKGGNGKRAIEMRGEVICGRWEGCVDDHLRSAGY